LGRTPAALRSGRRIATRSNSSASTRTRWSRCRSSTPARFPWTT